MAIKKDVVIIGGGPAGMAAAVSLNQRGFENIILIEKEDRLGGVLPQCIHDGFGLVYYNKNYTGPEYAAIYVDKIKSNGIPYITEATTLYVKSNDNLEYPIIVGVQTNLGLTEYETKAAIVSTGCRERGRGNLEIPGSRPSGIYTAGTAQAFINLKNYMPGKKAVIIGSGDIGLIMARRITLEGSKVVCVVEKEAVPGGLRRNVIQCLEDYDIPMLTKSTVSCIFGRERVTGVEISELGQDGEIIAGTEKYYDCDTVILSVGLVPEEDMIKDHMEGVFLCGNALYVHDLVDDVTFEGQIVAGQVETYLNNKSGEDQDIEVKYSYPSVYEIRKKRAEAQKRKKELAIKRIKNEKNTFTCILCPNGCEISQDLSGGMCSKGAEYVKQEILDPTRIITTSIKVNGGQIPLVSVRTTSGIPKEMVKEACAILSKIELSAPVKAGQIIIADFIKQKIDLVATKTVEVL